jgi:hypothetical protein
MEENQVISQTTEVASPDIKLQRRSSRKKHHRSGIIVVWSMIFLLLAFYAVRLGLIFTGNVHPIFLFLPQDSTTLPIAAVLVTLVGLSCLFLLCRGNRPMRSVFGVLCTLAAVAYAVVFSISLVNEAGAMWISYDLLALAATAYAAWTLLLSRRADRYFSNHKVS